MDAVYSGFSYTSSELRRAAQPAVDALAPILPTFGCGEAEVKQSAGNLIHELEAQSIESHNRQKFHMGWSSNFLTVKRIVLYPLQDPGGFFNQRDNCRDSTEVEMGMMANVTRNINAQLASWSIPFRPLR
jgi:hypothetical protein